MDIGHINASLEEGKCPIDAYMDYLRTKAEWDADDWTSQQKEVDSDIYQEVGELLHTSASRNRVVALTLAASSLRLTTDYLKRLWWSFFDPLFGHHLRKMQAVAPYIPQPVVKPPEQREVSIDEIKRLLEAIKPGLVDRNSGN
jgi:hypothetical protein